MPKPQVHRVHLLCYTHQPSGRACTQVSWLTPSELFSPHWGQAVARCILSSHTGPQPLSIVEIGAGSGTQARDILSYVRAQHPDVYADMSYRSVEISPALGQLQQRCVAEEAGHASRWGSRNPALKIPPATRPGGGKHARERVGHHGEGPGAFAAMVGLHSCLAGDLHAEDERTSTPSARPLGLLDSARHCQSAEQSCHMRVPGWGVCVCVCVCVCVRVWSLQEP